MVEPRFTRGEYWLLESVVELRCELRLLLEAEKPFSEQFNKAGHGLEQVALVETLLRLKGKGLIKFTQGGNGGDSVEIDLTVEGARRALNDWDETHPIVYELTAEGGAQWQAFARPNWDRFIQQENLWQESDNSPTEAEFKCADFERIKRFIAYYSIGWQPIELSSIRYSQIGSWNPTYWKSLPSGHQAKVKFCGKYVYHPRNGDTFESRTERWLVAGGFCNFRDSWYDWK